jgi:hypothetical protein
LYIRQNQTAQARTILGEILDEFPQNEEAWILSAQVSDKREQVLYCLRRAVKINPTSSRVRFLLDRLQQPQIPGASIFTPQPAAPPVPDTQPHRALPPAVAMPSQTTPVRSGTQNVGTGGNATDTYGMVPGRSTGPAALPAAQVKKGKRPTRWLPRIFTIAGTACLWAPWIIIQTGDNSTRTLTGVQVLLEALLFSLGLDVAIAALAIPVLPLLIFFRFKSGAAQKWGERATIALVPLAALLSLDLISSFYAGSTGIVELRWGIWLSCAFYSLAGLTAFINARRLGNISRPELATARAGRIFTWLFSIGDILAILVTVIGLVLLGKFSVIGIALPFIWLFLGALLSHIA